MSYCDLCHVYDAEHTDGEPDMMIGRYYKPLLDYFYSVEVMGEKWCDYNWGKLKTQKAMKSLVCVRYVSILWIGWVKSNGNAHHEFSNIRNKSKARWTQV